MNRPNINEYPKIIDGKHQYYHDDIEKYINYLESENKKMLIGKIKNLLFDYEVESAKPYPYDDKKVAQRITTHFKTKQNDTNR